MGELFEKKQNTCVCSMTTFHFHCIIILGSRFFERKFNGEAIFRAVEQKLANSLWAEILILASAKPRYAIGEIDDQ